MKSQIKQEASSIRKILNQWDPLGGSPEDEYDCLADHIVSALHRGITGSSDLARLIESELNAHFGIKQSEKSILSIGNQFINIG